MKLPERRECSEVEVEVVGEGWQGKAGKMPYINNY